MLLPDPRAWPTASTDLSQRPLHDRVAASLAGDAAARAALRLELDALLDSGADNAVQGLLRDAPSAAHYRHVQQILAKLVNKPERGEALIARLFAIPLVIVAGAKKTLQLPDALPDVAAVTTLLEQHGVLGAGRNFGLGNALCSVETLDCLRPALLRAWAAQLRTGAAPLELAGNVMDVAPGREQVYLRFLVGASVTPAHVPQAMETSVGAWGMPLTQLLAKQLVQQGLEVLPIPRAPVALYLASDAGRAAQIELAFSLFLSNEVRKFRLSVGDPAVVLSAHRTDGGGAELRVSLSSVFDDSLLEGFRWPLYPPDDVVEIFNKIKYLLDECRLSDISVLATVGADLNARGGRFLSVREVRQLDAGSRPH